jgi:aryl-alcohol dehydrogenase-like predicted oxidoreductase
MVRLGQSDLEIGVMGLGCMGMSEFYGEGDEKQSIATIHRAMESGVNFFDTADMYGVGHNEELLKKAFVDAGKRDQVVIATKFGVARTADGGWQAKPYRGDREYVHQACDASLKRLGVDTIDLYYQHRVDPDVPIEETVEAMAELVKAGKVRCLGLSEADSDQIRRAHAVHPISALQTEYSLWTRHVEDNILATCQELGITFVAYSPLGRGFLSGKYQSPEDFEPSDFRRHNPRFSGDSLQHNLNLVEIVKAVATEKNVTPAQVALAWIHAQSNGLTSIPGTKRQKYLEENVAALDVELTADDLAKLDSIAEQTIGSRY